MNLGTPLTKIFRISPAKQKTLQRMGLLTIEDLLYHFPTRYGDFMQVNSIAELRDGDTGNIYAEVMGVRARKTFKSNIPITEAILKDGSGEELRAI